MKFPNVFKTPGRRLALFLAFCFLTPYLAPLVQRASEIIGELAGKIVFALAATAVTMSGALFIRKRAVRIPVVALSFAVLELLILFEVFMFCFTGHSFDQSFLLHFNIHAIPEEVIEVFWKPVALILLVYFAAVAAAGILAAKVEYAKPKRWKLLIVPLALGLFFVPATPCLILTGLLVENLRASHRERSFSELDKLRAEPGKNLVFIVVESLEQNYLSEKHFPGLIPNISKWMNSEDALVFENMLSGATNTFDFLYQSHMGDYMYSITDSDYADRQVSLSLILNAAGYNSSFLKACNLDFASTGPFVKQVKYERSMDGRTPEVKAQVSELGAWGFRDYELFKLAKSEFKRLAAQKRPFVFTMFTVDSHAPTGVLGKKSLSYVLPDGEKLSLLSALHTTDAALGDFLEFIKNSPEGKDTVVVISGDHLVMRDVVPGGKSVQSMLEYKTRKNILTFILNGKDRGKFTDTCWPVDLAPTILYEMGVTHNAEFPCGINAVVNRNAAPRKKLSYDDYIARQRKKAEQSGGGSGILHKPVRMSGGANNPTMHIGGLQVKCDPLYHHIGTFMEFHAQTGVPTSWKNYLHRGHTEFFRTNPKDRDLFYMFCSDRENIFHFIFGERQWKKHFLAAIVGGWYKINYAKKFSKLKLSKLDEPLPRIADAKIDVSKNIVTLRKGGWAFPLFSKNDTYIPQYPVFAFNDARGNETVIRADLPPKENRLYTLLANNKELTLIAPPGSPLHRQFGAPKKQWDQLMRVRITRQGEKTELIPMRLPHERYIEKVKNGQYVLRREGEANTVCRLVGAAPGADFDDGLCYAATFDKTGDRIVAARSFRESRIAVEMMQNPPEDGTTLLICGRNSEFLKKYYPQLAESNVLFAVTSSAIRHAVQYNNGNFRIPAAAEPLDTQGDAGAHLADGTLIISWGNASFAITGENMDAQFAAGIELAIKVLQYDPSHFAFFLVNDASWLRDILDPHDYDYLLLGNEKSRVPEILQQKREKRFFISLARGNGCELFWGDGVDISINRKR